MSYPITITVNGEQHKKDVEPRLLLVHFLRETLNLTGTHIGCDSTSCGACTVILDGKAVKSCTFFAVQADSRTLETIEGVSQNGKYHPLQEGFWEKHGLQCGMIRWAPRAWARHVIERGSLRPVNIDLLLVDAEPELAPATAIDPVCGMTVEIASAHYRSEYAGQPYYFCAAGCKLAFDQAPETFVRRLTLVREGY